MSDNSVRGRDPGGWISNTSVTSAARDNALRPDLLAPRIQYPRESRSRNNATTHRKRVSAHAQRRGRRQRRCYIAFTPPIPRFTRRGGDNALNLMMDRAEIHTPTPQSRKKENGIQLSVLKR